MIRSMTGFGMASVEADGAHYAAEIRSLNNKYYKSTLRLPDDLQGLEAELDSLISTRLNRGSVTLNIRWSDTSADAAAQINTAAIQRYMDQLLNVDGTAHNAARVDISSLLHLPGVLVADTGAERLERARPALIQVVGEACDGVIGMREREGSSLHSDLHRHRREIRDRLDIIARRAPEVVDQYQERLRQRVQALLDDAEATVNDEDLIREVAIYAERSDIAEEITRLSAHLEQFAEMIDRDDDEPIGRTLDFLTQEMLREANTIASKSSDAQISRLIVEIKGAIDRMREQVQNVE